jgi:predicted type IV restriction endonuclease
MEERRVDYALCHPEERPVIFIEVKAIGRIQGADRQLFEYAFHKGIPMAILTDGQEWHVYLPAEQGGYEERRVYKLDLLERTVEESVSRLSRYLGYDAVRSGNALQNARADYQDVNRKRTVEKTIPKAWEQILKKPNETLVDVLVETVEDLCGYKPDPESCVNFLKRFANTPIPTAVPGGTSQEDSKKKKTITSTPEDSGKTGFFFRGNIYTCRSAIDVMLKVLKVFAENDSSFLDRFISRKHGRTRRYVARSKIELYPERPDLAEQYYEELSPGWFAGTNYNKQVIENVIRLACEVSGVSFAELKVKL